MKSAINPLSLTATIKRYLLEGVAVGSAWLNQANSQSDSRLANRIANRSANSGSATNRNCNRNRHSTRRWR